MKTSVAALLLIGLFVGSASTAEAQSSPAPQAFAHSFEASNNVWTLVGGAGFDLSQGYARTGVNNGFIRAADGWNAIQTTYPLHGAVERIRSASSEWGGNSEQKRASAKRA